MPMKKPWRVYIFPTTIISIVIVIILLLASSLYGFVNNIHAPIERQVIWTIADIVEFARSSPTPLFARVMKEEHFSDIAIQRLRLLTMLSHDPVYQPALKLNNLNELEGYIRSHQISHNNLSIYIKPHLWLNIQVERNFAYYLFNFVGEIGFIVLVIGLLLITIMLFYKINKTTRSTVLVADKLGIPRSYHSYYKIISGPTNLLKAVINRVHDLTNTRIHLVESVSHDIRTPLTRIKFRMERMLSDAGEKQKDLIEKTIHDLSEMDSMVSEVVETSRLGELALDRVDINSIIEVVVDDYLELQKNVQYVDKPDHHILLSGSISIYKRILENLINNALRFASQVQIKLFASEARTYLQIEDNGPGIPASDLEHLFKRHYQAANQSKARSRGGAGLGLSIVSELVHQTGGEIILENIDDEAGLRVTLFW